MAKETAIKEENASTMRKFGTVIHKCSCKSEYQDNVYGANMRVFNIAKLGKGANCTCCVNKVIL